MKRSVNCWWHILHSITPSRWSVTLDELIELLILHRHRGCLAAPPPPHHIQHSQQSDGGDQRERNGSNPLVTPPRDGRLHSEHEVG